MYINEDYHPFKIDLYGRNGGNGHGVVRGTGTDRGRPSVPYVTCEFPHV